MAKPLFSSGRPAWSPPATPDKTPPHADTTPTPSAPPLFSLASATALFGFGSTSPAPSAPTATPSIYLKSCGAKANSNPTSPTTSPRRVTSPPPASKSPKSPPAKPPATPTGTAHAPAPTLTFRPFTAGLATHNSTTTTAAPVTASAPPLTLSTAPALAAPLTPAAAPAPPATSTPASTPIFSSSTRRSGVSSSQSGLSTGGLSASGLSAGAGGDALAAGGGTSATGEGLPVELLEKLTRGAARQLVDDLKHQDQAHAAEDASKKLEELCNENHICQICYEVMESPEHEPTVLFPCGHTVCAMCLSNMKQSSCPYCKADIDNMAPNIAVKQLVEKIAEQRQAEELAAGAPVCASSGVLEDMLQTARAQAVAEELSLMEQQALEIAAALQEAHFEVQAQMLARAATADRLKAAQQELRLAEASVARVASELQAATDQERVLKQKQQELHSRKELLQRVAAHLGAE